MSEIRSVINTFVVVLFFKWTMPIAEKVSFYLFIWFYQNK